MPTNTTAVDSNSQKSISPDTALSKKGCLKAEKSQSLIEEERKRREAKIKEVL
jgi:hypothetical protein